MTGRQLFGDGGTVTSSAGRTVYVYSVRFYRKQFNCFPQQNGDMNKFFHIFFTNQAGA